MTTDGNPTERILDLVKNASFQNEVAQIRAKSLLAEVAEDAGVINWTYDIGRVTRNATGVVLDVESEAEASPEAFVTSAELQQASLAVAQLWESLAHLQERTTTQGALINAAILYQVAGYQANAACLASKLLTQNGSLTGDERLVALFVRRLFLACAKEADTLLSPPDLGDLSELELLRLSSSAMFASGLKRAAQYFLSGDDAQIQEAIDRIGRAERGLTHLGLVEQSNAAHGIRSLLPIMLARSTWNLLGGVANQSLRWTRYLKLLGRGTGDYVLGSPSVSELWPSQSDALSAGLLGESGLVVRVPTSAGKTRVAELAIVHTLVTKTNARCLYIAPYRALVTELHSSFINVLSDLGFRVASFVGAYDSDPVEQRLAEDADVLVATPERLDLILRLQPDFFSSVRVVILDEGQIVNDSNRGPKYELLLARLKATLPEARYIFLSAVIPQETIEDFATWLNANQENIVNSNWRPSVLRLAKFEWRANKGVIEYEPSDDLEFRGEFVHGVIEQRVFEHINPTTRHVRRPRFPDANHKAQTAAELAVRFAELGPVLVFCPQTNFAHSVCQAVSNRLDLMTLTDQAIPPYFSTPQTRSVRTAVDSLGTQHEITEFLRRGIAIHHGRLPDTLRAAVEADYRERRYRVLVATNTLAQGVNLPIRTIIIHSCRRRDEENNEHRISARDYWNIAGRAGRAGSETEGTVVHLTFTARDRQDYSYFLSKRDALEPVDSILFRILELLVQERIKSEDLVGFLDADLLPLLVEEDPSTTTAIVDSVIDATLASTQAARRGLPLDPLRRYIHAESERIREQVPDHGRRKTLSETGLSVTSGLALQNYIADRADQLRNLLEHADSATLSDLTDLVLGACMELDEMRPDPDVPISYGEALQSWLQGSSTATLHRELLQDDERSSAIESTSIEDFARFVSDFFTYKLPWGAAAFLRIASTELQMEQKDMSPYAKYLPAMIKFGLPHPEAAWAMSAGIPYRRVAMELGRNFRQAANESDFAQFREWLSDVNEDDLRSVYGLEGDALQDVYSSLLTMAPGELVRDLRPLGEALPIGTRIVGIAYGNRRLVAAEVAADTTLQLRRDYDNAMDRNAIETLFDGRQVGYLPRAVAQFLAPEIDSGATLVAEAVSVTPGEVPSIEVRINLQQ